jgi:hypothetical protein
VPSLASSSTATVWMFYGDAALDDASSAADTFLMGDDFRDLPPYYVFPDAYYYCGGAVKDASDDIFAVLWAGTGLHSLYRTQDEGLSFTKLSDIYALSSDRGHSSVSTDGAGTFYVAAKIESTGAAVYFKKSTDGGSSWGSEVTVVSGVSLTADPRVLYISGSLLLIFVRVVSGANFEIRCYESTDDGDNWSLRSTPHTEATAGLNSIEDLEALVASNGDIVLAWEREVTEQGEATIRRRISTDDGSTWGSSATIVDNTGTVDDEGVGLTLLSNGNIVATYASDVDTGVSYDKNQLFQKVSTDHGASWGSQVKIAESHNNVEIKAVAKADDSLLIFCTKNFESSRTTDVRKAVAFTPGATEFSDLNWQQDNGIAYVQRDVDGELMLRVDGLPAESEPRAFVTNTTFSGQDCVVEARVRSGITGTEDIRMVARFGSISNHYMCTLLGGATNETRVYKRVTGTYTSLNGVSFTVNPNTNYRVRWQVTGVNPTTFKVWVDGVLKNDFTEATSTQTTGRVGASEVGTSGPNWFDFMCVRQFAATDPSVAVGVEQATRRFILVRP